MNGWAENLTERIEKSAQVVLDYQQPGGAYPASPNFKNYQYCWFRDGAFIADGMSRAGQIESAELFFDWCAKIVTDRRELILSGGKLDARYTYDGQESSEEWSTFQLDGYGTWLWAMQKHAQRHGRDLDRWQDAAGLTQHYLSEHWPEPCTDWWEERPGLHAASLACIYAGLAAYDHPEAKAVKEAIDLSHERPDTSLLACVLLGGVDEAAFRPMLDQIETSLISPSGGVHRYAEDEYYGGGEWPLLTCMLGWYYQTIGRHDDAVAKLEWTVNHTQDNGWIAEQSQDHLLKPEAYHPWIERWGEPANPLLWSQAMFLTLATSLLPN
jgi:GH15 family glucan-1,4-alpha-glucosidase